MKYRPLFANVLVKPAPKENSLIVIDDNPNEPIWGEVVGAGEFESVNGTRIPLEVKEGDKVLFFAKDATPYFDEQEQPIYIINQRDIILVQDP